jgi:hypothetical protein
MRSCQLWFVCSSSYLRAYVLTSLEDIAVAATAVNIGVQFKLVIVLLAYRTSASEAGIFFV